MHGQLALAVSPRSLLFVVQKPSTYSQGNMGKFWGDLRWGRKSATLLRTVPSTNPTDFSSPRLGFATPIQNFNCYYLRNGQSCGVQIWPVHSQGTYEQNSIEIWEKRERRRFQGLSKVFKYPLLSHGTTITHVMATGGTRSRVSVLARSSND